MEVGTYFDEFQRRDWQGTDDVDTTRIAVVGLGWWTTTYAIDAIAASDYCELAVLVSGSADTADQLASEYDVPTILDYESYHTGDATDEYDAAYLVTPNNTHLDFAETAAKHGKDVICEKPLEATVERAESLVDICQRHGVTLMTAYRMQADPAMRRLREMLRDGVIGDPVHLHGGFSFHLIGGLPGQWRRDAAVSGGGSLTDIGVYPLNISRFLLEADPIRVQGETATPDSGFNAAADEHAAFQLAFPDAVTCSFTSSFNEYGTNWLHLIGTEGRIQIDPAFDAAQRRTIAIERDDVDFEFTTPSSNEVREEFDYFAYCRSTDTAPEPDGQDGLMDMRIMKGVYDSSNSGTTISL